jgi:hypothetical protein
MIPASNNMKNTEWAVAIFKDFAIRSFDLQGRFQFGGNDEINSLMEIFPYMYVQCNDIRVTPNGDSKSGYASMETTFQVTIADKLLSSKDNELQTVSDSQEIMLAVISELSTHPYYVANQMKMVGDAVISTTYEADDAIVSRVTAEITLRYPFRYTYCNQPVDNIPFYPTITTDIFGSVTQSICTLIEGCPVIINIQNDIIDLQDQINNIIATGGTTGPQGLTGPQGETGPQGFSGPQGPSGIDGFLGGTGPQGLTGPQGETGPQGHTGPQGNTGANGQSTSYYRYNARTNIQSGNPGNTNIIWDQVIQINATQINISHINQDNIDIDIFLALIQTGNVLILQDADNSTNYQKFLVTAPITIITNSYVEVPVIIITSAGQGTTNFNNGHNLILGLITQGAAGPQGITGPQGLTGPVEPITLNEIAFGTGAGLTSSSNLTFIGVTLSTPGMVLSATPSLDLSPTQLLTRNVNGNVEYTEASQYLNTASTFQLYGAGTDGDLNFNGTSYTSFSSLSGTTYSLLRGIYAENITIPNGYTLDPNGFAVFVKNTLTIDNGGKIKSNGNTRPKAGSGAAAGQAGAVTRAAAATNNIIINAGGAGGAGGNNSSAATGTVLSTIYVGGAGGSGAFGVPPPPYPVGGGVRGLATITAGVLQQPYSTQFNLSSLYIGTVQPITGGAGAGGAVGANISGGAQGGGGAGGTSPRGLFIVARTIVLGTSSFIQSNGGAGAEGGDAPSGNVASGGGGGGGGGGGITYILTNTLTYTPNGQIQALGGAGGLGGFGRGTFGGFTYSGVRSASGSNGGDGYVVIINPVTGTNNAYVGSY